MKFESIRGISRNVGSFFHEGIERKKYFIREIGEVQASHWAKESHKHTECLSFVVKIINGV